MGTFREARVHCERHWLRVVFVLVCLTANMIAFTNAATKERHYYVACKEVWWDYAPGGYNKITDTAISEDSDAAVFLEAGPNRIGSVYKKALFREYTDETFTVEKQHPPWLGYLGPTISGEVGENIIVHFKNMASRPYSMHPHGVLYEKNSEGALYFDGTSGANKSDDHVPPGGTYVYTWQVTQNEAPADDDPPCLTWMYHSHVAADKDMNAGLTGTIVTCKPGYLGSDGKQKGVDKDFVLNFGILDENNSWYIDETIGRYLSVTEAEAEALKEDEDFQESNLMHGINGYLYGNLPGLDMCVGENVTWHLVGRGGEVDIHTIHFRGHEVSIQFHRTDTAGIFPASFATAVMEPRNIGEWMVSCQVGDHFSAGMQSLYNVAGCGATVPEEHLDGTVRHYYIAAEMATWDYAPSGINHFEGGSLLKDGSDSIVFFEQGSERIGGKYKKALYMEYTDATFTVRKNRTQEEQHLGMLGPVIRSEVGDTIMVTFKNMADRPYSIEPHGVFYNKSNEGSSYGSDNKTTGGSVEPGETFTYVWTVPPSVAPTERDPTCLVNLYRSGVSLVRDAYSGLVGPMVVCKAGTLDSEGNRRDVSSSREFFLMLAVYDENQSWYLDENIADFTGSGTVADPEDEDFAESNLMHGINGYMYANLPGLSMCTNDNVTWYVMGLGTEVDIHTLAFHGLTFQYHGQTRDSISIFPGSTETLEMVPDNEGEWAIKCVTNDHYSAGMKAKVSVETCDADDGPQFWFHSTGTIRTFYIAAVEEEWDYAEDKRNIYGDIVTSESSSLYDRIYSGPTMIGSQYKKAMYREYTDPTFTVQKQRGPRDKHLGMLGPMIEAEIGDVIVVYFKNMASHPYSMHPHGLLYSKWDEGALYEDKTSGVSKGDDVVEPNGVYAYTWFVPPRAGPTQKSDNCIPWAYYSSVDPVKDTSSGLIGPLVVCRQGTLGADGRRSDVDREFVMMFTGTEESNSWYLDENIQNHCGTPAQVDPDNADFVEANHMFAVNGYVLHNLLGLEMVEDEDVVWYLMGMGTEVDTHTVHFHGQTFIHTTDNRRHHRGDVWDLFPGEFAAARMRPENPGTWIVHCHVADHFDKGMMAFFTIKSREQQDDTKTTGRPEVAKTTKPDESPGGRQGQPVEWTQTWQPFVIMGAVGVVTLLVGLMIGCLVTRKRSKGTGRNVEMNGYDNNAAVLTDL
ncbi:HEPHL1 [Branchiostoma lanceolatum]|uniref:ferroxidase n=1 Tax=Branchiostoma lanceolatum TaxID=7740 RepID=A0A8K0E981_BRALA|nr:HEPHL1 [Branchiostoma lanceolatum]